MSFIKSSLILGGAGLVIGAGTIYFGLLNPGADEPHSPMMYKLIETARDRAIAVRAEKITVPALNDVDKIKQGAGNYAAMCTGCHLAPGIESTEMHKILYPAPPDLSKLGASDPARAFWVIKHGIKASGMAAWGTNMKDDHIWNMVAFVQQMPKMTPEQYRTMVAESGGHSHGGGENMPADHHDMKDMEGMAHGDGAMEAHHLDEATPGMSHGDKKSETKTVIDESKPHDHPPGSEH